MEPRHVISLAVIGIGGFGATHVAAAKQVQDDGLARFAAAADKRLHAYPEVVAELTARGVACYSGHEEMFSHHRDLDLVTLPLPIPLHAPMTIECLGRGVHVLVEKPPAGSLADAEAMAEAAIRTGRLCGVSFQLSTSAFFRAACAAIAAGKLGAVTDVSALCLAQRPDSYYARTPWAGRIWSSPACGGQGRAVRDGPLNNPFAHISQLLLSFAGAAQGRVARPVSVEAELYAGHDIESADTDAIRARLDSGATLHFYASLCSPAPGYRELRVTGTQGTITWCDARCPRGELALTGAPPAELVEGENYEGTTEAMLRDFIAVAEARKARLACPVEDTLGHAALVEMAFMGLSRLSAGCTGKACLAPTLAPGTVHAGTVPRRITHLHGTPYVRRDERGRGAKSPETYIEGIDEVARRAFESGRLYSEVGAPWACPPTLPRRC